MFTATQDVHLLYNKLYHNFTGYFFAILFYSFKADKIVKMHNKYYKN